MRVRLLWVVALLILVAGVSFASGGSDTSSAEAVSVEYWAMLPWQDLDWFTQIMDRFTDENPNIDVEYTGYGDPAILDALYAASASKTGPDAYFLWFGWQQWPLVDAGFTLDLTPYKASYQWEQRISSGALELASRDGKLWGVPFGIHGMVLWSRKDLLDKYAGGQVPTNMAQLRAFGDKLAADGLSLAATASVDGWQLLRYTQMIIENHVGVPYMDRLYALDPSASWDTPQVVESLRELKTWGERYFQEGFLGTKPGEVKIPFYNGQAAIDFQGEWNENNLINDGQEFDVVVFPFPVDSQPRRIDAFIEQHSVTSSAEHPDEAVKFIDYFVNAELLNELQAGGAQIFNSTATDFNFMGGPLAGQVNQWMSEYGATPPWDGGLPLEFTNVVYEVQDGVTGGTMTPEEGARRLQQGWVQIIPKYRQ